MIRSQRLSVLPVQNEHWRTDLLYGYVGIFGIPVGRIDIPRSAYITMLSIVGHPRAIDIVIVIPLLNRIRQPFRPFRIRP